LLQASTFDSPLRLKSVGLLIKSADILGERAWPACDLTVASKEAARQNVEKLNIKTQTVLPELEVCLHELGQMRELVSSSYFQISKSVKQALMDTFQGRCTEVLASEPETLGADRTEIVDFVPTVKYLSAENRVLQFMIVCRNRGSTGTFIFARARSLRSR
jgi:hypothetical protein